MIIFHGDPARARTARLIGLVALVALTGLVSASSLAPLILVFYPVVLVIWGAWPLARWVFIPMGWPRAARYLTSLATLRYGVFAEDMGRVAAAWAFLRRWTQAEGQVDRDRVEEVLMEAEAHKPLDATQLLARGLMLASRGDMLGARRTIGAVETFSASSTHEDVFRIASDFLIAEAATRGAWDVVARVGREPRRSRAGRFMGLAAGRMTPSDAGSRRSTPDAEVVSDHALRWAWLTSGSPFALKPIFDRAMTDGAGGSDAVGAEPVQLPVDALSSPLSTAMTLELALVRRSARSVLASDVERLGRAWDRALLDVGGEAARRARELGVIDSGPAIVLLEEDARAGIVALAERSKIDLGALASSEPQSRALDDAARIHRNSALETLETQVRSLRRRVDERRSLAAIDEWREWDALVASAEAAFMVGGISLRRVAFPVIHVDVCAYAVWLTNERRERRLAHVIFSWLLGQARAVDDAEAIRLQERNASATMG